MTDAHCHVARGETRHFLCDPRGPGAAGPEDVRFTGCHPWDCASFDAGALRESLAADPSAGVGETGLDRLRDRVMSSAMRRAFEAQLEIAAEFGRPVVVHGAKCWGETVRAARAFAGAVPAFLFHGFSRSAGLLGEIGEIGGFISVGPALLNDHAVNYRELAKAVPAEMLLVESDATEETALSAPRAEDVARKLAELRGEDFGTLSETLEANASRFVSSLFNGQRRREPHGKD